MRATFRDPSCARYSLRPVPSVSLPPPPSAPSAPPRPPRETPSAAPLRSGEYRISERDVAGAKEEVVADLRKDPRHEE
jgi:hypothetical protein